MEEEGNIDVFNTTMNFLIPNGLTPSASLLKEYSESEVAKRLQLPTRDYLNSKFAEDCQISEEEYKLMKERSNSRPPFIYFFNPCFKTEERVWESKDCLLLGYFKNGTMIQIGAGMSIDSHGYLYQGYYNNDCRHNYGRCIDYAGNIFEGGLDMGFYHGKGEIEYYRDGTIEKGSWVKGYMQGTFEYIYKSGIRRKRIFMNGKEVRE